MTVLNLVERIYDSAERAGFLQHAVRLDANGQDAPAVAVAFQSPDENILDGYQRAADYRIRFPSTRFTTLNAGDTLRIANQTFRVREVRAIGDGSEREAKLSLL
ncbi:hypothetical protein [Chitinibacter sp. GC72]|uniref:head-tail joining protein n=1 Tax=Chitinibacter sp. GC72 TaxID=1526917 RepID=UPI0012FA2137|nr:hypothetical protein [Chitinibacter sp. GC72]